MKLTNEMIKVIADIEFIIGSECYNPNSYDGWNDIEGCDFRYPINLPSKDGSLTKIKANINKTTLLDPKDIDPETIGFMKYRFGSNELFIGQGIIKTLNYLEERYGIDFNELETHAKTE